ncbi:unnamed protein product [Prunus brigantina]
MLVGSEALNEHVVYIHFDRLTDVFSEHMIYQSLVLSIQKIKEGKARGSINQLIDSKEGETFFGISLVEICEVYTHTPLLRGFFFYHNHI